MSRRFSANRLCCALCTLLGACQPAKPHNVATTPAGGMTAANMLTPDSGPAADGGDPADNPLQLVAGTVSAPTINPGQATGCRGLQCQQHKCDNGSTTISGRVYDPAGKNPLYNVAVYVPNETPAALQLGASCAKCDSMYTGKPVVTSLSDAAGRFTIRDAPDGKDIPLVIQIGKWRKQIKLPNVARCADTAIAEKLTLPRNHLEGDIPNIAISTGTADTLECLLRRIGVDASEYVPGANGEGRVHIFQGSRRRTQDAPNTSPPAPQSPSALWNDVGQLMKYDIVLLSCEGQETPMMNQAALHAYADAGGRVFASHFHYAWFNTGPYASENLAVWTPGSNDMGTIGAKIVTSFPKGQALADWLANTNALTNGELTIQEARHNADVTKEHVVSQAWIQANASAMPPMATQYFSFNTPTMMNPQPDGPDYCGRVVFSDLHIGAASQDKADLPVPTGCADRDLSPQEKALEFMLFDLSACVIPDDRLPEPPPALN